MSEEPPRYKTFLLTVWEERKSEPHQPAVWRFGLEDPQSGQRRAFSGLEALSDALGRMVIRAETTDESRPKFTLSTSGTLDTDDEEPESGEVKKLR